MGDEQLLLLRLLAGMVLHEIRMLRGIFNENDNYCQLVVRIFSYMTGKGDSGHQSFADGHFFFPVAQVCWGGICIRWKKYQQALPTAPPQAVLATGFYNGLIRLVRLSGLRLVYWEVWFWAF